MLATAEVVIEIILRDVTASIAPANIQMRDESDAANSLSLAQRPSRSIALDNRKGDEANDPDQPPPAQRRTHCSVSRGGGPAGRTTGRRCIGVQSRAPHFRTRMTTFAANAIGLDFLNALGELPGAASRTISDGETFLQWLEDTALVPAEVVESVRKTTERDALETVAADAKALGKWFRTFVEDFKGAPLPPHAIERLGPLNRILERDVQVTHIDVSDELNGGIAGSGLKWSTARIWRSPDMLLLPVADAMAELVCEEDFSNVRSCEGPECGLLFLDRTRGRVRRWCSMAVCGNRAKRVMRRSSGSR
ncbi:CGNR zinc finger domain-containing protein [Bradyrhizobium ivorense]|uniref:CGNR zinc finger domain-containing protein n=1 Tax=Bradyrhizobium ivorense TaxID=2511166 RepID=UPI001E38DE70|nr:CGNR zinc finger domain-containing protein [Bradyrhizobium ivorense]